jgi:arabinofuranosyltransferase
VLPPETGDADQARRAELSTSGARPRAWSAALMGQVRSLRLGALRTRGPLLIAIGCGLLLLLAIVRAAWMCEDAFITLRTVDNWVNGYGLRWNVSERVQSYTHPLWMFIVAAAYWPSRDPAVGLVLPSLLLSGAFVVLFIKTGPDLRVSGALLLLLGGTKGFVEFSSPGLENPLVHVLLVLYAAACLRTLRNRTTLWPVTLCASLLTITRPDILWLIGPSLLLSLWRARRELARARSWLGALPLAAWEAFSLVYYGFPVANTAYAKLTTGVPPAEAVEQGLNYLRACYLYDPVTAATLCGAVVFGLVGHRRALLPFVLGLISWVAYLVSVGGDFMIGRLLTPALALAVITLAEAEPLLRIRRILPLAGAAIMAGSAFLPRSPLSGAPKYRDRGWLPEGVTDERALAYPTNGLFRTSNPEGPRSHPWVQEILALAAKGERVVPYHSVGIVGYYAGPEVHIVDEFGLADPLLARLPADPAWSAGHFFRHLPEGYVETLRTGVNQLEPPLLARRYSELKAITRDPLFSVTRWRSIVEWNLRRPRIYPRDYEVRHVSAEEASHAPGDGETTTRRGVFATEPQGLVVTLAEPTRVAHLSVTLGSDDRYQVSLREAGALRWQGWFNPDQPRRTRLKTYEIDLPAPASIDSIWIRGRQGDHRYHVGRVTFGAPSTAERL